MKEFMFYVKIKIDSILNFKYILYLKKNLFRMKCYSIINIEILFYQILVSFFLIIKILKSDYIIIINN